MTVILFDGRNHPPAATLVADGIGGGLLYTGTPASGKDFTAAQYADYKAHGLITIMGYENTTTDINGGYSLGFSHATDFLKDCRTKGVSLAEPALAAVDEHVSAANLELAMQYQFGFRTALRVGRWTGPIGIYGFSEVLIAAHAAGNADFYFGAGSRSTLPPYTNIWQDNTGTILVDGSADDRDVVLIPLPTEDNVALTPADIAAVAQAVVAYKNPKQPADVDMHQHAVDATSAFAATTDIKMQIAALAGALSADEAAVLAAIKTQAAGGDVNALAASIATALAPQLGANQVSQFMAALKAQFEK